MEKIVTFYEMRMVKEKNVKYETDIERLASSPSVVNDICTAMGIEEYTEEAFLMFTLNTKNKVTGAFIVSKGTLDASLISPREVFKRAIMQNSNAIIIAHNHPSGDPTPSNEDKAITQRLIDSGNLLGIQVLDHIVLGDNGKYLSFKERGLL